MRIHKSTHNHERTARAASYKSTRSCHEKGSIFSVYFLESPVFKEKKKHEWREGNKTGSK
jgi:hypothetical protein